MFAAPSKVAARRARLRTNKEIYRHISILIELRLDYAQCACGDRGTVGILEGNFGCCCCLLLTFSFPFYLYTSTQESWVNKLPKKPRYWVVLETRDLPHIFQHTIILVTLFALFLPFIHDTLHDHGRTNYQKNLTIRWEEKICFISFKQNIPHDVIEYITNIILSHNYIIKHLSIQRQLTPWIYSFFHI